MRDKIRRKFVCVKIIKIKNIPKKEREATKVEVELLKRLNHPNIVRYIDSFLSRNNESLCIAMEYCDGGDLASQIKAARRKLFSEDKILHWFVQIALGVHYMHTKNVLHRDLKTQNIFLLGNGRLVLGDLGISKVLEGTMDFAQTCIGTPYYMSPEIFKNKPYSYKSDVWALGCVLYEMTTLNHAFDANSLNGLAQKIIKGRYPSIHHKYSRYLRELIGHMLLPEPKQRPDLDQILRKPFIRKHILNFFQNIASRPSQSIGEGTMIVRAAAGGGLGGGGGALANDVNMLSFKDQLDSLGMTTAINEVLGGKQQSVEPAIFEDPVKAKRLAKEQSNALKREQDHRKMVESALEKLRKEREERAKDRNRLAAAAIRRRGGGGAGGEEKGLAHGRHSRHNDGPNKPAALRQPSKHRGQSEETEAAHEKGKRVSEAREYAGAQRRRQEAQAAQHRREAEDRREREAEQHRARQREDLLAREKREAARAQEEASARREQQRQRERGRQMAEIDQLKKDKLELDKRAQERDRIREERRTSERARLEEARHSANLSEDSHVSSLSKMSTPDADRMFHKDRAAPLSEDKDVSARDRMLQRKQVQPPPPPSLPSFSLLTLLLPPCPPLPRPLYLSRPPPCPPLTLLLSSSCVVLCLSPACLP
jgi:NIMA (never in mitosis gene a)-related kinase 1/4/5